ncbi:MAG: DUF4136 domain-containing protein [bacterium]|nr:DUF4136 domain-containing protein [bacterium]
MVFQKRYMILLILAFFMSGCTNATKLPKMATGVDHDPSVDFSILKSYDWMPESPFRSGDPRVDDDNLLHARIRNAVDRELAEKGFVKLPSATPDFLVGYHVTVAEKTSIRFLNNYYGYTDGWGLSYEARTGRPYQADGPAEKVEFEYQQGTVILDMATPDPRQLIWRGEVTASIDPAEKKDAKSERVNNAVKRLLQQFPPPQVPEQ